MSGPNAYNKSAPSVRREKLLALLQTALRKKELAFARQTSLLWLSNYPGDLLVNFVYASVLAELGDKDLACANLAKICRLDPEFIQAVRLYAQVAENSAEAGEVRAALAYLSNDPSLAPKAPKWLKPALAARQAMRSADKASAEKEVLAALAQKPGSPLPAVLHMQLVYQSGNQTLLSTLSGIYLAKWPDCLQIKILSALSDMQQDKDSAGVEKMHWCAAHDTSGQVITRLLGPKHNFKPLWPEDLRVVMDVPIPASIASELGLNRLGSGSGAEGGKSLPAQPAVGKPKLAKRIPDYVNNPDVDYSEVPSEQYLRSHPSGAQPVRVINDKGSLPFGQETVQTLTQIQKEFDHIAKHIRKDELTTADGRYPNYVLFTSRSRLVAKYGENTATVVIDAMKSLTQKVMALPGWNALVYVPDDPNISQQIGLTQLENVDPVGMKQALVSLDKKLGLKGEMIGALLIVGGNEIVPFHMLPNPTDDSDASVPSDNPYATIESNYFLPQWPVGRIPDEVGNDAGYLIEQLRFLNNEYSVKVENKKSISGSIFTSWFLQLFDRLQSTVQMNQTSDNIGLTAEVWKVPSAEVFKIISPKGSIRLSPPIDSGNFLKGQKSDPKYAYFNLHGMQDTAEWYGQKDFRSQTQGPEYPVALVPELFNEKAPSPEFVISEACYGGNILGKTGKTAICMNVLAQGTRAFVGSTTIAYGSVSKPLIAADLLAQDYLRFLLGGETAGYALMRAKLNLAKTMTQNQGYLDGEDQKTILSFVLYGDPLASKAGIKKLAKPKMRPAKSPVIKTLSDSREETIVKPSEMPAEIKAQVQKVINSYLPNLGDAKMAINPQLTNFTLAADAIKGRKYKPEKLADGQKYFVSLRKSVTFKDLTHPSYARLTFNSKGEIIKLSISR
ncbi:MAG: hypothetical protein VB108_05190 [Anaerolineaceae bacterium]|nr:hypothetical protein [Anaerolineaceae bacterium]